MMPLTSNTLSLEEVRRIALHAQGMASASKPAGNASWNRIADTIERINLLQIDSVNVLARSHYLPVLARVGSYKPATLDKRTLERKQRQVFEYWAHEASFLPMKFHPLFRWRMAAAARGEGVYKELRQFVSERQDYLKEVLEFVRQNGPTRVSDLPDPGKRRPDWWSWSDGKTALEFLFWTGQITTAERRNFERIYDIPERVIPAEIFNSPTPSEADAIRELLRLSARALGAATETDLRDYFRLPVAQTKTALAELLESGELHQVEVEGWDKPAFLARDSEIPRRATATALLSPFDPLVWERSRAERIFGFRYRIEIYTPAAKRVYGYYVLPFLHKGRLAGRVCLKSDRQDNLLRINAAHVEPGYEPAETADALASTLRMFCSWLGLSDLACTERGNLASQLRRSLQDARAAGSAEGPV